MNRNERFVVTINRELGSGGRAVGQKLAERLGVPFYDKAVIKALQEKFALNADEIERLKAKKSNWWTDFQQMLVPTFDTVRVAPHYALPCSLPDSVVTEDMYHTETQILQGIAEEGSCVIAGRSAFHIFRHHPNHLNILILASLDYRTEHLMARKGIGRQEALDIIQTVDKGREQYINKHTGTSRYDARNYQLVVSMDGHTEEQVLDLILDYIERSSK